MKAEKVGKVIAYTNRKFVDIGFRIKQIYLRHTSSVNQNPIFILGNQKSGTSAITGLLGQATGKSYCIDLFCWMGDLENQIFSGAIDFKEVLKKGRYYFSKDIIKDPGLTFLYPDLVKSFPNSKVVFVLRNPLDNIRSILNRVGIPGNLKKLNQNHWDHIHRNFPFWHLVLDGKHAGHKGENYIETLAKRCALSFNIYLNNREDFIPVIYEQFLIDKMKTIESLANELDLRVVNNIENSLNRQFQPRGNSAVDLNHFFGAANIEKIQSICGEHARRVGYDLTIF